MRKAIVYIFAVTLVLAGGLSFGQTKSNPRQPLQIDSNFFNTLVRAPRFMRQNRLSAATNSATRDMSGAQPPRVRSVQTFSSSFAFQGQTFPYTMVGRPPQAGNTTRIATSYIPMSLIFDEFVDANGNSIFLDANAITDEMLHSPNFERAQYTVGNTQFGDAVQRAEFFNVMRRSNSGDDDELDGGSWHTILQRPRILTPVVIEVPVGSSVVFQIPGGGFLALIDINFLASQLNTLLQTEGVRVDELPIFTTRNALYGDFFFGFPLSCCIAGFHTAIEVGQSGNTTFVQTFAFASSLDADIANGGFGDPTFFADVQALSHEISEWMNDPFTNNIVPDWQFPGLGAGSCSNLLETGDPVENLPSPGFPVILHGFTYHPQTEALLQWFSRENPSSAIGGAYSYPGNNLTSPSQACPK
ncbi:MAG TPA: hypothetical protein VH724_01360 [Candidatus Angelobacter sp.]|nr:hypothetical protein [Candidatus Angelobacter sp.]